jgi:hypothetical protein
VQLELAQVGIMLAVEAEEVGQLEELVLEELAVEVMVDLTLMGLLQL